jgi:hypothetical protein
MNDNNSGFTTGNPMGRILWSRVVTNPTSWIIADCIPDGFEWKDLSKIQIDNIYYLLDHWKASQDSGLEPLVWASTGPLFQDNNKTAKNLQASRYTLCNPLTLMRKYLSCQIVMTLILIMRVIIAI